MVESNQYIS
ncbi:epidermal growth factor receptor, partial [Caerostris darwini]